jgi:hypothetical protein
MKDTPEAVIRYLSSLWGVLSAASVLFPGAAALLKAGVAPNNSQITPLYAVIPTVIAAFSLLLLTSFRQELRDLRRARKAAVIAFVVALISLFAALLAKQNVDVFQRDAARWNSSHNEFTVVVRDHGSVQISTFNPQEEGDHPVAITSKGDPVDIALLVLFALLTAALTIAFGTLGIHSYEQRLSVAAGIG